MLDEIAGSLVAQEFVNTIDVIQMKLKKNEPKSDGMNYLLLTELYSLRTRVYIIIHEHTFFKLDKEISEEEIFETFQMIKKLVNDTNNLLVIKKIIFLFSMLVSSLGVGENEIILNIINRLKEVY